MPGPGRVGNRTAAGGYRGSVFRTALRLRWLPRHLLLVAVVTAMSWLGRWQWDVSQSKTGSLQNLLYAFQWWAMALIVIYGWWRLLRDDAYPQSAPGRGNAAGSTARTDGGAGYGTAPDAGTADDSWGHAPVAAVDEQPDEEPDEQLAAYNRYLAWLNARAEQAR